MEKEGAGGGRYMCRSGGMGGGNRVLAGLGWAPAWKEGQMANAGTGGRRGVAGAGN